MRARIGLLVDDDENTLRLFDDILVGQGFAVDAYSDPVTALIEFKSEYFDLLILDYRMPTLNGLELFNKMRERDKSVKGMLLPASYEQLL
ncbi:MAG TPA: response regulator [Nitrososphaeraceae archaeon]